MQAPRPPEQGTPGYLALQDQLHSAIAEITAHAAELVHGGAFLLPPTGPWAEARFASVAPHLGRPGRRVVCAHIAHRPGGGPQPLYTVIPALLCCRACFDVYARRKTRASNCDRCGRPAPYALRPVISQREQVLAHGHLCPICLQADRINRSTGGF